MTDVASPSGGHQTRRTRRWVAACLAALLLYTLAGFFLVPRIIDAQIRSQAMALLGREAEAGEVQFNPFTLATTITGLRLADRDGADLVTVARLHANLQVSGLFRRALRFREIRIDEPTIAARILADGRPSVADLMTSTDEPDTPGTAFELPRLIVDRFIVGRGVVEFSDASRQPAYRSRFEPLDLDVTNLITIPEEGGAHAITIGVGDGAELRWTGQQIVEPLRFTGQLEITGLGLRGLWDYFGRDQTLDVRDGRADLTLPYAIARAPDGPFEVSLNGASAHIRSLAVQPRGDATDWLTVPDLRASNVDAVWPASELDVGGVTVTGPHVLARLDRDGVLNWARAVPDAAPAPADGAGASPWTWRVTSATVEEASVTFEDERASSGVQLDVAALSLRAENLSSDLTQPVPFTLEARVGERGAVTATGSVAPAPTAIDTAFDVSGIDLAPLQAYLELVPGAVLHSGIAGAKGQVSLSGDGAALTMTAGGTVEDVEIRDLEGERLAAWQRMTVDGLTLDDPPGRTRIRAIVFDRPYAKIHIDANGALNLTNLTGPPEASPGAPAAADRVARTVEVGTVDLRDASAEFTDESLILPFAAQIHSANGSIRDLSSFAAAPATVNLEGRVDETGHVSVGGTLRLADPMAASEITVGFRSIEMLGLTPYFAQFAGYAVRQGVLDLDVRYLVNDRRLVGSHTIVARDLVLGERVKDSAAPGLAVRLAVALLKDREGRINLDVPIEGTVDSPEFAYRQVFWSAVRTILGNAATAPFRALGRLFGRDDDDLDLVEFDPGRSDLLPAEQDTLARLAEQLGPKPELALQVAGRFDPTADTEAMKRTKLDALIESRREAASAAAAAAGASTLETILETLFTEQFSTDALQAERQRFTQAAPAPAEAPAPPPDAAPTQDPPAPPAGLFDAAGFYESLRARLFDAQSVTDAELTTLANARASAIVAALTASGVVEATRVSAADIAPVQRRKQGSARIAAELRMSAGD